MNYDLIGKRIQELRTRKHMSQATLAELTKLSVNHIGYLENANRHPTLETLIKLADVLDTTVDYFLIGNQTHDTALYHSEFSAIVGDCSAYERHVILLVLRAVKAGMIESRHMLD